MTTSIGSVPCGVRNSTTSPSCAFISARTIGEIHETRQKHQRLSPLKWFFQTLPQTFRRHIRAFWFSVAVTLAGCAFGGFAIAFDPASKSVLMHKTAKGYDEAKLQLKDMQRGKAPNIPLATGDIIFVPFSFMRNLGMNGASIVAAAGQAAIFR